MKITEKELRMLVKETVREKLLSELSSLNKEVLPGSGEMGKIAKKVDDFLLKVSEDAKELVNEIEEEMKVDMLGGVGNPSAAPRIGERNRMLSVRAGVLKKLSAACVSMFEYLRRES